MTTSALSSAPSDLTPRQIVAELDRYIIGQAQAKRMVAIALRNRVRRRRLPEEDAAEISPKNIILIGPTGVGKTEIARRLASLAAAPFVKVEATKFTEVGYVGRDVESMIRDLVENAINLVRTERRDEVKDDAERQVEEEVLDLLLPPLPGVGASDFLRRKRAEQQAEEKTEDSGVQGEGFVMVTPGSDDNDANDDAEHENANDPQARWWRSREKLRAQLREGKLDERQIEIDVTQQSTIGIVGGPGMDEMGVDMQNMLEKMIPKQTQRRELPIKDARPYLLDQMMDRLIDHDSVTREALLRAEEEGIVFVDEIDKIAGRRGSSQGTGGGGGPDVSREGVQRDILPIVEGTTVKTKYGYIDTDHILFVAAGAFSQSRPSDLIPELQGRFPLRSELEALTTEDFKRILTEPRSSLCKQYTQLLGTDGVALSFTPDGIRALAEAATQLNDKMENIGARRLHTLMERVLEDASFTAPDDQLTELSVDANLVKTTLSDLVQEEDLQKFIL
jgi:ATP-dependent HslUV protease ATP-binding subunit HslU